MAEAPKQLEIEAKKYQELAAKKKKLAEETKDNNAAMEKTSDRMVDIMEARDIQKIVYADLGTFSVVGEAFPKMDNEGEFYQWCKNNGHEDLWSMKVPAQTLRAFVKSIMEDGKTLPPGIVPGYLRRKISVRAK